MLSAGQRNHRVRFERRVEGVKSPSGNLLEEWSALIERWAGFLARSGREAVRSGQLDSTALGTLTVLRDPDTVGVTAADRVVFIAGPYAGWECQIRSIVPTPDNREIEMVLEQSLQG